MIQRSTNKPGCSVSMIKIVCAGKTVKYFNTNIAQVSGINLSDLGAFHIPSLVQCLCLLFESYPFEMRQGKSSEADLHPLALAIDSLNSRFNFNRQ